MVSLIHVFKSNPNARLILYCFPYSGGTAAHIPRLAGASRP